MSKISGSVVQDAGKCGKGLFAKKCFLSGDKILSVDLTKLRSFSLEELKSHPLTSSDHWDYVGRGRYVLTFLPYSYMNHSCNPNCVVVHKTIAKSDVVAMRDIKIGEELTYDYGVNAMDCFGKKSQVILCKCNCVNCRRKIHMSFFQQPVDIQKKYFRFLPSSLRNKYRKRFLQAYQYPVN